MKHSSIAILQACIGLWCSHAAAQDGWLHPRGGVEDIRSDSSEKSDEPIGTVVATRVDVAIHVDSDESDPEPPDSAWGGWIQPRIGVAFDPETDEAALAIDIRGASRFHLGDAFIDLIGGYATSIRSDRQFHSFTPEVGIGFPVAPWLAVGPAGGISVGDFGIAGATAWGVRGELRFELGDWGVCHDHRRAWGSPLTFDIGYEARFLENELTHEIRVTIGTNGFPLAGIFEPALLRDCDCVE